jgi:hypothetical protein
VFLLPSDTRRAAVILGAQRVAVSYPARLAGWLDDFVETAGESDIFEPWVAIDAEADPERFCLRTSTGAVTPGLDLGETISAFWEHVTYLLIDLTRDGLAVHAAAARRGDDIVLIPGTSGAGKTHLVLWYQQQGFAFGTDEVVVLSPDPDASAASGWRAATLRRPIFLKGFDGSAALANASSLPTPRAGYGTLVPERDARSGRSPPLGRALIVFPRYLQGAPFVAEPLTSAQAGLRLLEHCVNVRNLPRGGLGLASQVARNALALSLSYGDGAQLTGTLDVLTRQVLASQPDRGDFGALCAAFTARAASNSVPASTEAPAATAAPTTEERSPVPARTEARYPRRLTIGMATYDDYDGVFFTIQSIRTYHPEIVDDVEFVVIDNNPGGRCSEALKGLDYWINAYRYVPRGNWSGTAIRDAVFEEASSDVVLCVDSHVLIVPGAIRRLIDFCEAAPDSRDLIQGPLVYDDLRSISTHFEPRWQAGMYGVWATDERATDPDAAPFDIPMQGLGLFACRRSAWPGFNPAFRGFGGEEGYIHEKIRRRGGRTLCLPFLRWVHRFGRPMGLPYVNRWEDRIRNYVIGFKELGFDTAELEAHFTQLLGDATAARIFAAIRSEEAQSTAHGRPEARLLQMAAV